MRSLEKHVHSACISLVTPPFSLKLSLSLSLSLSLCHSVSQPLGLVTVKADGHPP